MGNLIECKISKEDLKILYKKLCVYENGTGNKKDLEDSDSRYCDKCVLRNIEWIATMAEWRRSSDSYPESKPIIRDLCFAIWHDDILNEPEVEVIKDDN